MSQPHPTETGQLGPHKWRRSKGSGDIRLPWKIASIIKESRVSVHDCQKWLWSLNKGSVASSTMKNCWSRLATHTTITNLDLERNFAYLHRRLHSAEHVRDSKVFVSQPNKFHLRMQTDSSLNESHISWEPKKFKFVPSVIISDYSVFIIMTWLDLTLSRNICV